MSDDAQSRPGRAAPSESNFSSLHVSNPDHNPPLPPFAAHNRNTSASSFGSSRGGLPPLPGTAQGGMQMEELGHSTKGVLAGSSAAGPSRAVVQHEDAGAVLPDEIPPA